VQQAWAHNTVLAENVKSFMESIYYQLQIDQPRRFRWHVGGDCPTPEYIEGVIDLAEMIPETSFLIFSKRYRWWTKALAMRSLPSNLSVFMSAWVGVKMFNPLKLPVAWVKNPKELDMRIAKGYVCPGDCRQCKQCWLANSHVIFNKH
jgi:hypothetical protein